MVHRATDKLVLIAIAALATAGAGCGGSADSAAGKASFPAPPAGVDKPIEIHESDLYQQRGDLLYLYNKDTGLNQRIVPLKLGGCDIFMSHSWHDTPSVKWEALTKWAANFEATNGRELILWLDKACIDQQNIDLHGTSQ